MTEVTRTVTPNKAKNALRHAMRRKRPVFLWGPPGIGKSDVVKQIADTFDAPMIDVRLSLWEPTDIKGIPYFDSNQNKMVWGHPKLKNRKAKKQYTGIELEDDTEDINDVAEVAEVNDQITDAVTQEVAHVPGPEAVQAFATESTSTDTSDWN